MVLFCRKKTYIVCKKSKLTKCGVALFAFHNTMKNRQKNNLFFTQIVQIVLTKCGETVKLK